MDSFSSMARIFSVSLYWMADLIPRRTLTRSSSLAFIASTRSFWIFSERVIGSSCSEYSRGGGRAGTLHGVNCDGGVLARKKHVKIFAGNLTWRDGAATVYVLVWANFCRRGGALHTKNE